MAGERFSCALRRRNGRTSRSCFSPRSTAVRVARGTNCYPTDATWIDSQGKLAWHCGEPVLAFGKHRERSLKDLVEQEADYLRWVLDSDFPEHTKSVIAQAMEGRYRCRSKGRESSVASQTRHSPVLWPAIWRIRSSEGGATLIGIMCRRERRDWQPVTTRPTIWIGWVLQRAEGVREGVVLSDPRLRDNEASNAGPAATPLVGSQVGRKGLFLGPT